MCEHKHAHVQVRRQAHISCWSWLFPLFKTGPLFATVLGRLSWSASFWGLSCLCLPLWLRRPCIIDLCDCSLPYMRCRDKNSQPRDSVPRFVFCSCLLLCCCHKHHDQSQADKGEALFDLTTHSPSWRDIREELNAGTWRREVKQRPWRSATHCLVLHCFVTCFCYITQDLLQRDGVPTVCRPPHINHLSRKLPIDLSTRRTDGGEFSAEVASFQVTLVYVKWTKTNTSIH